MTPCAPANNPRQRQRERSAVRRLARVRQAVPSDAAALVELVAAVTAEPGGWYGEPGRWTAAGAAELIESACRDGGKAILVAEVDGQLVAQLCMEVDRHPGSSHVADVSVMVAAARRRCGIATALMAAAESVAAASQLAKIELHVRPENAAAIALYAKLGYRREGLRRAHYQLRGGTLVDLVVMAKVLGV